MLTNADQLRWQRGDCPHESLLQVSRFHRYREDTRGNDVCWIHRHQDSPHSQEHKVQTFLSGEGRVDRGGEFQGDLARQSVCRE